VTQKWPQRARSTASEWDQAAEVSFFHTHSVHLVVPLLVSAVLGAPFASVLRTLELTHSAIPCEAADALLSRLPALTSAALSISTPQGPQSPQGLSPALPWLRPHIPPPAACGRFRGSLSNGHSKQPLVVHTAALAGAQGLQDLQLCGHLHMYDFSSLRQLTSLTSLWLDPSAAADASLGSGDDSSQASQEVQRHLQQQLQELGSSLAQAQQLQAALAQQLQAATQSELQAQLHAAQGVAHELQRDYSTMKHNVSRAERRQDQQRMVAARWQLLAALPELRSFTGELQVPWRVPEPLAQLTRMRGASRWAACCLTMC
jgi:hypothetical protein